MTNRKAQDRHRVVQHKLARELDQRERLIRKLITNAERIKTLQRAIVRLDRKLAGPATAAPEPVPQSVAPAPIPTPPRQLDDDPIPTFLDRRNLMADPKTKEKNAERRAVEREKREAKLRGQTKRMPLSGRAALDAIKAG